MGVIGYTMQIYCDFSGYSDMAIGIAMIMGFTLMKNFDFPTNRRILRNSGAGGTSRSPHGCATMFIFLSEATAKGHSGLISTTS